MTPDQVMAARNLLGWTRGRLAAMSDTTARTVLNYERDGRLARAVDGTSGVDRLAAIRAALEAAGVEFIEENGGGPGVRLQGRNGTAQDALAGSGSVTLAQLKAAREMLGWGVQRLAGRSGTSSYLIKTYERSGRVTAIYGRMSADVRLAAIRATLEEAGVEFVEESETGLGVRMRHSQENA